jgi:ferredoxin
MPRVELDLDLCQGHAVCEDEAPEVFSVDDNDHVTLKMTELPDDPELLARVETACTYCPTRAITVVHE